MLSHGDSIDRQNAEFDALDELSECWKVLQQIAVVDDDYPEHRRRYESAMHEFIVAIRNNGRLNSLGLTYYDTGGE